MLKIVFIDDEYFFRNSLKSRIPWEEYGFEIVGDANNGMSGMELILEKNPDIAVIDINMPVLSGLELIEKLSKKDVHCKYILLTGYDDFKYAQKAIRLSVSEYILKPVDFDLLLDAVNNIKNEILREHAHTNHIKSLEEHRNHQIKENFLLDLINGYFSFNETSLISYLKDLHIRLPFNSYTICLIQLTHISSKDLESFRELLEVHMSTQYAFEVFMTGHSQICIIEETLSSTDIKTTIRQFINYLNAAELTDYHLGISSVHHGVEQIIIAYNEARLCMKNAVSQNTPIQYNYQVNTSFLHITDNELHSLKKMIRLKQCDELQKFLSDLYSHFKQQQLSYDNIVFCTYELLSCLIGALNEQADVHYFSGSDMDNFFNSMNQFHTIDALEQWIISFFLSQIQTASSPETNASVAKKIAQYIHVHYSDMDLNIDSISKNLFLNYSYICYCFKKDMGITINDYINQIRLEQALKLFHSGHDNVGYVAEQTGFNTSGYFSKKFKKAFGLSPSEYIKTLS